ncbi:MAG: AAA family ATPase [Lachnospiraceae bacterium]|nr:AAA family ATPase [Lachnospiraceae bacterium]
MNIKEAKNFIKDTVTAYLKKDEFGDYRIPVEKQRPIFLIGSPGIGKTAIMSQIASELGIALVSYSMTHHTRQSALGLPFIEKKKYGDTEVSVSEYTMSEIIASIYDTMEESGIREGILFLDEINCVSETLYPSMLQFLQYKLFGKHAVPPGWVIVTAGNPPEYNRAVREFDVVTLDRMKVIPAEADYPAWASYAAERKLHGAVTGFLAGSRESFYKVETTAYGKTYVTARGWEDLSDIICLYEEDGKTVNEDLICQYITDEQTVKDFAAYYDLYCKYKKQYDVEAVFTGTLSEKTVRAASSAPVDERLALTGLLADSIIYEMKDVIDVHRMLKQIRPSVRAVSEAEGEKAAGRLDALISTASSAMSKKARAGSLSDSEKKMTRRIIRFYTDAKDRMDAGGDIKSIYNERINALREDSERELERIRNLFEGMEKMFGDESNEMLVLVTKLTLSPDSSEFLSDFRSDAYEHHCSVLKVGDRSRELRKEIEQLGGLK